MNLNRMVCAWGFAVAALAAPGAQATTVLYSQDFEHPNGFVNDGADVNVYRSVNQLYGNQPDGFMYAQNYTVETLNIKGTEAFGHGYSDPSGKGGHYALSMHNVDLLGLVFNIGSRQYLNLGIDLSSIDLSSYGGPYVPVGTVPTFRFTLFDNPTGEAAVTGPRVLDYIDVVATASPADTFDWTSAVVGLNAAGNTNGNVLLQIDLLNGVYAAMDNLRIAASDIPGDVGSVPEPGTALLLATGLTAVAAGRRRRGSAA